MAEPTTIDELHRAQLRTRRVWGALQIALVGLYLWALTDGLIWLAGL